ncbi:MAG TPA: GGDEF domain-containing protein [Gammaproteobacteria bacterium]|nr:GGDEF domain-containing protein [Gammaproteobacteria bacterium]
MKPANSSTQKDRIKKDVLYQFRDQIFYRFSLAGMVLILPFSLNNLYEGRIFSGSMSFLVLLIFLIDAIAMRKGKPPPIPPAVVCIPIIIGIGITINNLGFIAAVWMYPAIILFFFIMPRITANIISLVGTVVATLAALYYQYDMQVITRIMATCLLTIVFINVLFDFINQLNEKLNNAAIIDELTGAYNRRHMKAMLKIAMNYKKRYDTSYSVLSIDIDHFKSINDNYGHSVGDSVLRKFTDLLQHSLRKVDTVFRVGGEEFNILLPESDLRQAASVAEKIRLASQNKLALYNKDITISIGVGELKTGESMDDLLKRCDMALYKAKEQGRNRVCLAG